MITLSAHVTYSCSDGVMCNVCLVSNHMLLLAHCQAINMLQLLCATGVLMVLMSTWMLSCLSWMMSCPRSGPTPLVLVHRSGHTGRPQCSRRWTPDWQRWVKLQVYKEGVDDDEVACLVYCCFVVVVWDCISSADRQYGRPRGLLSSTRLPGEADADGSCLVV